MAVPADRSSDLVFSDFHRAVAASDEIIATTGLEALTALPVDGRPKSLRWVIAHTSSEIVRHAGHADILRELIDGTTGR